jgi:hypothetical protein
MKVKGIREKTITKTKRKRKLKDQKEGRIDSFYLCTGEFP